MKRLERQVIQTLWEQENQEAFEYLKHVRIFKPFGFFNF
jgi:hypothetical protein